MKATLLIAVALTSLSTLAMANSNPDRSVVKQPAVEQYTYATHLDVAKVLATSDISTVCGVVPATMTYLDHQGAEHVLQYQAMGNGCANG